MLSSPLQVIWLQYLLLRSHSRRALNLGANFIQNAGDAGTKAESAFDIPPTEQRAIWGAESGLPPPERRYAGAGSMSQEEWNLV